MCENYLLSYYKELIIEILKDSDELKHFSLDIDFVELTGNDPNLGNTFLTEPEKSLEEWNVALSNVQTKLIQRSEENYSFKKNTHCRIYSLPLYPELHRIKFPQNDDTNKFLQVSGTVFRMTAVKMLEYQRQYICSKCKYLMTVNADYHMKNIIKPPKKCKNPEQCNGSSIICLGELNAEFCKDYQEVKIQETVSKLDVRSMPKSMWVTLEDDLVDTCKPGDNITVCGLVKLRHEPFIVGKKMEMELVLKANHIQVNNNNTSALTLTPEHKDMFQAFWKTYSDSPLAARDMILKSICPEVFGLFMVKLAVALVLAGGSNLHNNNDTGTRVRTEPHLLLVGDPGTGKSQLLRFASKIIPRSVLTTGVGSTAAGLTVTAVMENGEWQLEGGALVMSDGGICCIDEFNTMKEHDRTSIHEAMEQQTISVAKAGIVCKLSTRCSILAATNPKGNLDFSQPLSMNVALPSPLLSRFDLILLLKDKVDGEWDSQLAKYILNSFDISNSSKLSESINWTVETLQAYFAVIKKIHPELTEDSNKILSSYYQAQRRKNYRNKARTTVRLLDSLVRLSQGHARLMYHEKVSILDAIMAVILVETAMEAEASVFNLSFNIRGDFPENPTENYKELAEIVLKKLELHDLLQKEFDPLRNEPSDKPGPSNRLIRIKSDPILKLSERSETSDDCHPKIEHQSKFFQGQKQQKVDQSYELSEKADSSYRSSQEEIQEMISQDQNQQKVDETDDLENPGPSQILSKVQNQLNLNVSHKQTQQKFNEPLGNPSSNQSKNQLESNLTRHQSENNLQKPGPSASPPIVLSQKTRTRNFLNKFRFVAKENQAPPESVEVKIEPTNSFFENEGDFGDISFGNVETSTQRSSKNTLQEEQTVNEKAPKRFNFKKVTSDKMVTNLVTANVPPSLFESHEDLDDLDLDL